MTDALVVFCTCENQSQALEIANALIETRLAACVNILPAVHSIYRWQGKVENAEEVLLLIKTTESQYSALEESIRHLHRYDTPEIVALPIVQGSEKYLAWLRDPG